MEENVVVDDEALTANDGQAQEGIPKMKLKLGRTVIVGLAFLTICMFWQVYDSLMPLFLSDFGLSGSQTGVIMALDNILALCLLPFMGLLSDRFPMTLRAKFGRRMPFIVCGSILAGSMFLLLNYAHNKMLFPLLMVATVFVLLFMCLYRTPAVSLMPDITPKQIRSQGNVVINAMGTIGGVIALVLMTLFTKKEPTGIINELGIEEMELVGNNWTLFIIIAGLMILATAVMIIKVKENRFVEDKIEQLRAVGIDEDEDNPETEEKVSTLNILKTLSKAQLRSLIFILSSVFLWYMAYNGITTHFSYFAMKVVGVPNFTMPLLLAQGSAFAMLVPSSMIGKKIGRKFTVMLGVLILIIGFGFSSLLMIFAKPELIKVFMYPAFVFVGAGWATINVHSYVMSVEMATEKTTGVFTGLYYTFAMSAQIITPILAGFVRDYNAKLLMLYAFVFSCLALLTMIFVKHGNAKDGSISADAPILKKEE